MPFIPPTILAFSGTDFDFSPYSLRGLTAKMEPISQSAQITRDINGNAIDLGVALFHKYRITITCEDQETPGFASVSSAGTGVWPGSLVSVTLPPHLGYSQAQTFSCVVVEPWSESFDEYAHQNSWQLVLEQV